MRRKSPKTAMIPSAMRSSIGSVRWLRVYSCFAVLLILIISASAHAGEKLSAKNTAVIFGTVWSPDDRPVYGVTVKIRRARDKAKHARWEVYSNHLGEFEQVVPGGKETYILWADTKGFKTADGKRLQPGPEVTVEVEDKERVDTGVHLKWQ
jgi:hypothetical protein